MQLCNAAKTFGLKHICRLSYHHTLYCLRGSVNKPRRSTFSGTVYMFIYLKNGILQIYAVFPPQSVCISV